MDDTNHDTLPALAPLDRIVFVTRPRCPRCESTEAKTTRSIDNGDGTRTQRKRCRKCNAAYEVVWE